MCAMKWVGEKSELKFREECSCSRRTPDAQSQLFFELCRRMNVLEMKGNESTQPTKCEVVGTDIYESEAVNIINRCYGALTQRTSIDSCWTFS